MTQRRALVHRVLSIAIALVCGAMLAGLVAAPAALAAERPGVRLVAQAGGTTLPKVRVATVGIDLADVPLVKWAADMKTSGVADVELVDFENGALAIQATVSGATQFAVVALLNILQLVQQTESSPLVVVVHARLPAPTYMLVATKAVPDLKGLEGKKVGISTPGDISDTLARVALKRAKVDVDKVTFVKVGGTRARVAALQQGSIDAGMAHAFEALTAIASSPTLKSLVTVGEVVPDFVQQGIIARTDYVARNRELVQKLVDGLLDTDRWASEREPEFIELARRVLKGSPNEAIVRESYREFVRVKLFDGSKSMREDVIRNTLAIQQETGALKGAVPEMSRWLDASFVRDYLKRKGLQ
jgi:NitT/TauT family transport system substrate-binding protein